MKKINSSNKVDLRREVVCDTQKLANGRYAIIPCTKDPGESADFSINVYYDCKHEEIKFSKVFISDLLVREEILCSSSISFLQKRKVRMKQVTICKYY